MSSETIFAENTGQEINLRHLLFFVFKKRRILCLSILAFVLVWLCMSVIPVIVTLNNEEDMASNRSQYDLKAALFRIEAEALEKEIEAASANLAKQTAYNDQSLRMKIDPYHEAVAQQTYYIDTGYQIIPENTYQDIDYSSRLIKMYMAYLTNGNAYSQLMEQFPAITDEHYIREIMFSSPDASTSTITLIVIGNDQDTAEAMLDVIRAGMQEVYAAASDVIGRHSLSEIDDSVYTTADTSLAEEQQRNFEQVVTLSNLVKEKTQELKKLKTEGEPQWEFTGWEIAKGSVKAALIAAVLGWIVSAFILALYYVISDKILDAEKLQSLCVVSLLGVIPRVSPKRMKLLDRAAARICGIRWQPMDRDAVLAVAAQSIYAVAKVKGMKDGVVALAGSIGADALRELADALSGAVADARVRFAAAGDPMRDSAAIEAITTSELVVIVEKQGVSKCSDVVKENVRIRAWGKPVLGAVLLDADEI